MLIRFDSWNEVYFRIRGIFWSNFFKKSWNLRTVGLNTVADVLPFPSFFFSTWERWMCSTCPLRIHKLIRPQFYFWKLLWSYLIDYITNTEFCNFLKTRCPFDVINRMNFRPFLYQISRKVFLITSVFLKYLTVTILTTFILHFRMHHSTKRGCRVRLWIYCVESTYKLKFIFFKFFLRKNWFSA